MVQFIQILFSLLANINIFVIYQKYFNSKLVLNDNIIS